MLLLLLVLLQLLLLLLLPLLVLLRLLLLLLQLHLLHMKSPLCSEECSDPRQILGRLAGRGQPDENALCAGDHHIED